MLVQVLITISWVAGAVSIFGFGMAIRALRKHRRAELAAKQSRS